MTYAARKLNVGEEIVWALEIDVPRCTLTHGIAPCTATETGDDKCFNLFATCNDTANFTPSDYIVRFASKAIPMPGLNAVSESTAADLRAAYFAYPMIESINIHPTKASTDGTLGRRGALTVQLRDAADNDSGMDDYLSDRTYDPLTRGTFWSKFLKRVPYLEGKTVRLRTGYSTDPWDWDNFKTEYYIVESVTLDKSGSVTLVCKDPLKLADDDRATAPTANTGTLLADIDNSTTSATLSPTGIGNSEYASSGTLRIGSEVMAFTRSGDALTLTRAQGGTTATAHSAGDTVQESWVLSDLPVADALQDLLEDFAGISASWVPKTDWDTTANQWFPELALSATITEPTGVTELLNEILTSTGLIMWWDAEAQEVKLDTIRPPRTADAVATYTEADEVIEESVTVKQQPERRVSRIYIWHDPIDVTRSREDRENYRRVQIYLNADQEAANAFGTPPRILQIFTRFYGSAGSSLALQFASRIANDRAEIPSMVTFDLDARDSALTIGDLATLNIDQFVDFNGAQEDAVVRVLSRQEVESAHKFRYTAERAGFKGRYAFIGPNTLVDFASEDAADIARYGFIADNTPLMSDGSEPYKIF